MRHSIEANMLIWIFHPFLLIGLKIHKIEREEKEEKAKNAQTQAECNKHNAILAIYQLDRFAFLSLPDQCDVV